MQHLRQACRRLARTPGFTTLAVLTLALAFGAHLAIFSLINALFLRPLPVADPATLMSLYQTRDGEGFFPLSLPDSIDYQQATKAFQELAAHYPSAPLSLRTEDGLVEINGSVVSDDYFPLLGIQPARGRFFGIDSPTEAHTVVISHALWQRQLRGDAAVIGSVVYLNGTPFTVLGVAPPDFVGVRFGLPSAVWLSTRDASVGYRWCDTALRDCTWLTLIGRLAPGRTPADAQREMTALSAGVQQAFPLPGATARSLVVTPLTGIHPAGRASTRRLAHLLLLAVTLVVLVAGANLGGLLVGRGLARRREIATRLALGATGRQVVSLFLLETLLLSGAGGLGGLLVATGLGRLVALFYPSATPLELPMDFTVVGYGVLLALVTGLLVGGIPGLQASRRGLVPALQEARWPRLLGGLVVVQGALSFVLLLCTGLLVQSLGTFHKVGGTDPETVATLRLRPRLVGYTPAQAQGFLRRVTARLEALPGVEAVTLSAGLPPFPFFNPVPVHRTDEVAATDADGAVVGRPPAYRDEISPGLFANLGIPLLGGRDFDERDGPETPPVVIVNQALARMLWPDHPAGEAALGETLRVGSQSFQVVGVVRDAAYRNREESALPQFYTPYWQNAQNIDARLLVRATRQGDAAALLPALRREIAALDPNVPVTEVETLSARLERTFAPVYLAGRVLTVSGGLALFLSAVGLYGILALAVAQRTREIGIRMALGGRRTHIMGLVLRDLLRLTGLALALGLVAAVAVTGRLTHYLYGVGPHDPATFGAAVVALVLIAALAGWWPAHRASRVDPLIVLRQG